MSYRNGVGVRRGYDYSRFAGCPEYQALADALDALLDRSTADSGLTAKQFRRIVTDLVDHLRYSDCCPDCFDNGPYVPLSVTADGVGIECRYRCDQGHRWQTGWTVNWSKPAQNAINGYDEGAAS
jgi:hypothetical protein